MTRKTLFAAGAGLLALAVLGAAVAKADNLTSLSLWRFADPQAEQDRLLAKAAFTQVLEHNGETLGIHPPDNDPLYAPIYPDAFVFDSRLGEQPTGGQVSYSAAADVPTLLRFYEDAAALAHLPIQQEKVDKTGAVLVAGDGRHAVSAKLTKQFKQSTQADVTYS